MSRALLVVPCDERSNLAEPFARLGLQCVTATTCETVRRQLSECDFEVIIASETLPDGAWGNVLRELLDRGLDAVLVVAMKRGNGWLWNVPVQRGGEYALVPLLGDIESVVAAKFREIPEQRTTRLS